MFVVNNLLRVGIAVLGIAFIIAGMDMAKWMVPAIMILLATTPVAGASSDDRSRATDRQPV